MDKVMICLPTKDDGRFLPKFLGQLIQLSYPKDLIRIVIVYSKEEPTSAIDFLRKKQFYVEAYPEPQFENLTGNSLWIADVLNHFKNFYKGEDFILVADTDLSFIQQDLIQELIKTDKDIIAPYIWHAFAPYKEFFDTYIFRYNGNQRFSWDNPPFKNEKEPKEVESVGTIFLIKSEVFIKVNWDNPAPHLQFCKNARRMGYKVWVCPYIAVFHADVRDESHPPIEDYINKIPIEMIRKVDSRL